MAVDTFTTLNDHARTLMFKMDSMRHRNFICDFTVKVDDQSIPVHRVVLAAFSDYFEAMFANDMMENRQGFVELQGMDANSLKICIEYMYAGKADLSMDNIVKVYQVADMLQCRHITNYCIRYLGNILSVENWTKVKSIANTLNLSQVTATVEIFVANNLFHVSNTEGFQGLDITEVMKYLKKGKGGNEFLLWQTTVTWMTAHQDQERRFIDVLRVLDIENFSFHFLFAIMLDEEVIKKSKTCQNHIISAIFSKWFNIGVLRSYNCLNLLRLAKSHGRSCPKGTVKQIHNFISKNYMEVFERDAEYLKLGVDDMVSIQKNIDRRLAMAAWYFSKAWVNHCLEKRAKFFPTILENLDLKALPVKFLMTTILEDDLVKDSESCKTKLISTLFIVVNYKDLEVLYWFALMKFSETHRHLRKTRTMTLFQRFFEENFKAISSQPNFEEISSEQLSVFLQFPTIAEEYKWQVLLKWIKADVENRKRYITVFLSLLNLRKMSHHFIRKKVSAEPIVQESDVCKNMIKQALSARV